MPDEEETENHGVFSEEFQAMIARAKADIAAGRTEEWPKGEPSEKAVSE